MCVIEHIWPKLPLNTSALFLIDPSIWIDNAEFHFVFSFSRYQQRQIFEMDLIALFEQDCEGVFDWAEKCKHGL